MIKNIELKKIINIFVIGMGVFFTSLIILCLESILNRMFAATFWYHFAFIVLSIALFGIGVGGIIVYFIPKFIMKYTPIIISYSYSLFYFYFCISPCFYNSCGDRGSKQNSSCYE